MDAVVVPDGRAETHRVLGVSGLRPPLEVEGHVQPLEDAGEHERQRRVPRQQRALELRGRDAQQRARRLVEKHGVHQLAVERQLQLRQCPP